MQKIESYPDVVNHGPIYETHSHLHTDRYNDDRDLCVKRAQEAGVKWQVWIGENPADTRRALETAAAYDNIYVAAGVHPHKAAEWNREVAGDLQELCRDPKVVAVGEMGLDYYYDFVPRDKQKEVFIEQMELAGEAELPIIIHCREAYDDTLEILEEVAGRLRPVDRPWGIFHCWFGDVAAAKRAIDLGFLLGIGGSSTFAKAEELHRVIASVPLETLVLETDAPYMTPIPCRGKRNEPCLLPLVADRIAHLKGVSAEEVIRQTTTNACRVFST